MPVAPSPLDPTLNANMSGPTEYPGAIRTLVEQMAVANPLWGAPRVHGELGKLGIEVSERTVSRLLRRRRRPPSQTWRTLLTNHVTNLVSMDFFTVPTLGIGQAPDRQTARHCRGRLTFVVRPELERLAFGFRGKDFGGCDMDGIERTNVNGERTLGLVDDAGVDSCKVEGHEQISQLLPLDSGFGIVKVSDETFAVNSAERFNFNELRRDDTIAGSQRERWPGL